MFQFLYLRTAIIYISDNDDDLLMVLIYLRLHLKGLVHLSVVGKSVGKFSVAFHPAGKISSRISTNS